jgi:phage/plasmid primase-like uncharacterized protein
VTGAAEIAGRLGLRRASRGWAGNCPACGYRDGFRLSEKAGRALWNCGACDDRAALTEAVTGRRGGAAGGGHSLATTGYDATKAERAMRLWHAAQPIEGSPAQRYLATRALALPDGMALRYVPDAYHPSGARAGCMIALAVDVGGKGQAIHRTYLAPGGSGKAALDPPRATLGPVAGAVARLCELHGATRLVIGEGLETSLSAGLLAGAPAWAALSAGNMARVPLPDTVAEVLIAADHDGPGQRAAWAAADAFMTQGRRVQVIRPNNPGDDFNDLLQRQRARENAHA